MLWLCGVFIAYEHVTSLLALWLVGSWSTKCRWIDIKLSPVDFGI